MFPTDPPADVAGPLCPHFGDCGGCATQDVPYADQLAAKDAVVREALAAFAVDDLRPILPSPDVFHYRNKMEFAFGGLKDAPPLLGLRQKGKFDRVVDLSECRLLSPEAGPLMAAVRRWAEAEKLPTYHLRSHRGFLRYLVVREGKNTGQRMAFLVTAAGKAPKGSFLKALDDSGVRVDAAVWTVNDTLSDLARGQAETIWRGDGTITETLEGKPYVITPTGFFQTNTRGAEKLYGVVRDFLGPRVETLIDFYCGAGSIGLFCMDRADRLLGVELHAPSVESARANARAQGAERAEFVAADAAAFARDPRLLDLWGKPGTMVVMDPPRPGLAPEVRRLLLERPVARWVYVSCNPKALSGDLAHLSAAYAVEAAQPVDLFPHTPHVETALLLRKK